MLPSTVRENDIVEVVSKDSDYYGTLGKFVGDDPNNKDKVIINVSGKTLSINRSQLQIKARIRTKSYRIAEQELSKKMTENLTKEDYDNLINFAIDIRDFDWANELVTRKNNIKEKKK